MPPLSSPKCLDQTPHHLCLDLGTRIPNWACQSDSSTLPFTEMPLAKLSLRVHIGKVKSPQSLLHRFQHQHGVPKTCVSSTWAQARLAAGTASQLLAHISLQLISPPQPVFYMRHDGQRNDFSLSKAQRPTHPGASYQQCHTMLGNMLCKS